MRANELMVGDWVSALYDKVYYPCRVVAVFPTEVHVKEKTMVILTKYDEWNEVKPIPLTAEILEANGFDVMVYDGVKMFAFECVCIKEYKGLFTFKISDCRKRINYVHELQHALRLCGIEKEIELWTTKRNTKMLL